MICSGNGSLKKKSVLPGALILILLVVSIASRPGLDSVVSFDAYAEQIPGSDQQIAMVPVPGGHFLMGSETGNDSEKPVHEVEVGDFWMAAFETTWDQYLLFSEQRNTVVLDEKGDEVTIDVDGISSATTPYIDMSHGMGKNGYPVINVTQHAALTFCKWLSAKTGRFYRLPTEAEWEYACRAGSNGAYSFGADSVLLGEYGWYKANSDKKYHPVGQKKPNAYGLYDMHGNVAEWTMDAFDPKTYSTRSTVVEKDPWVIPENLYPRTVRGGSWQDDAGRLRSSARLPSDARWKRIDPQIPKSRWWFTNAPHVGFRVVRPRTTPSEDEIEKIWLKAIDDY